MLLGDLLLYCLLVGAYFPEVNMPKMEVVLRVAWVDIEEVICVLPSCLTLVSLMMTLNRVNSNVNDAYILIGNTLEFCSSL